MTTSLDAILRKLQTTSPQEQRQEGPLPTVAAGVTAPLYPGTASSGGLDTSYAPAAGLPSTTLPTTAAPIYNDVSDFAFDAAYAQQADALQRQLASAQSDSDLTDQQDQANYLRANQDSQTAYQQDLSNQSDRFANQGILRSGINVKAQGDLATALQTKLNDYTQQKTEAQASRQRSLSQLQQSVQDQIASLQLQKTERQQAKEEAAAKAQADALALSQPQTSPTGAITGSVTLPDGRTIQTGVGGYGSANPSGDGTILSGGQWEGGVLVPGTGIYRKK